MLTNPETRLSGGLERTAIEVRTRVDKLLSKEPFALTEILLWDDFHRGLALSYLAGRDPVGEGSVLEPISFAWNRPPSSVRVVVEPVDPNSPPIRVKVGLRPIDVKEQNRLLRMELIDPHQDPGGEYVTIEGPTELSIPHAVHALTRHGWGLVGRRRNKKGEDQWRIFEPAGPFADQVQAERKKLAGKKGR